MAEYTISNYVDDNGKEPIKDWLKSLDGTRTEYLYENDPQGNRIIDYKITVIYRLYG